MKDHKSGEDSIPAPLTLVVNDQEWTSRSIESILQPRGHAVVKAFTARQALDLVDKLSPDAILVGFELSDMDGVEIVRRLRASPTIMASTPILGLTMSKLSRAARLEALKAGVWDVLRHPVDAEEFVVLLDNFIGVKQSADRLLDGGLSDPLTGFYNAQGLLRRAREISADAQRLQRTVACVALGGERLREEDVDGLTGEAAAAASRTEVELVRALRAVTRVSDAVGRLPSGEFVVLAPGADDDGARQLIDRMKESLDKAAQSEDRRASIERLRQDLRGGYYATSVTSPAAPEELLLRATQALRRAQDAEDDSPFAVRAYEA